MYISEDFLFTFFEFFFFKLALFYWEWELKFPLEKVIWEFLFGFSSEDYKVNNCRLELIADFKFGSDFYGVNFN